MSRRAQDLAAQGEGFVVAIVVRAQRPTSVKAGDVALVLADGTIEGFVGGACVEHSVRAYSLEAIRSGESVLLRILPFGDEDDGEVAGADGAVTVQNPCLSGGAIEVFLEPVLPAPRVLVVGETPIAGAILRIGPELGLDVAAVDGESVEPRRGDLALVVAAHGRDELHALRCGLDAGVPYVGLVASGRRGDGVLGELRGDGVSAELLARIDVPAGLDIGARSPAEIALSILAQIVAVRHGGAVAAPARELTAVAPGAPGPTAAAIAVDPVCGMTVAAVASTPSVRHDGKTVYFCCEGCRTKFRRQHEHAVIQ